MFVAASSRSSMVFVLALVALSAASHSAAQMTAFEGRHLLQGGNGGNGGAGGAGGSSGAGGTPGAGGASGLGGAAGSGGTPGTPGAPGQPGGTFFFAPRPPPRPAPAPAKCRSGQYKRKGQCTNCVSPAATASYSKFRGVSCRNPVAFNGPSSCSPARLYGVLVQSSGTKTCITSTQTTTLLLLPGKNKSVLAGLTVSKYNVASISLAGYGVNRYKVLQSGSDKRLAVEFKDTKGIFKKNKGKSLPLTGVYRRSDGVKLCFSTRVQVCK